MIPFREKIFENRLILFIILLYALYQLFVNLPLTIINYAGHVGVKWISELSLRLSLLQIPLFYFFLFNGVKTERLLLLFTITSVLLIIFGIYNYFQGQYIITNTGEIRTLSGIASIFFVITIFNHTKLLGANKNNLLLVVLMLFGVVLTVHRSVYLTLIITILIYIWIKYRGFGKIKIFLQSSALLMIIFSLLFLIPGVSELFFSRAQTIFDIRDGNYYDRALKNTLAFEMFLDNPINGTNLTGFYYNPAAVKAEEYWRPHNVIFEILPTQGIIGLFFIILIFSLIFRVAWRNINDRFTEMSFIVLIYYILLSLSNASFFYNSCTNVLTFFSALILWRNKVLKTQ